MFRSVEKFRPSRFLEFHNDCGISQGPQVKVPRVISKIWDKTKKVTKPKAV